MYAVSEDLSYECMKLFEFTTLFVTVINYEMVFVECDVLYCFLHDNLYVDITASI